MGGPSVQVVVYAGNHSGIAPNLAKERLEHRGQAIVRAFRMRLITHQMARDLLRSKLIPNPRTQNPIVYRHSPLAAAALAFSTAHPDRFTKWFYLTNYQKFVVLSALLELPAVIRCRDGCIATRADALMIFIYRLANEGSWEKLMEHGVFCGLGASWSPTKAKSVFRAVSRELHRLHGARVTWSKAAMARHAFYGPKAHAVMSAPLAAYFAQLGYNVCFFMDGTRRQKARQLPAWDGTDMQQKDWNAWWHKHGSLFVTVCAPSGLIAACSGPHFGHNNDQGAVNASGFIAALQTLPPNVKCATDDGFANGAGGAAGFPLVGKVPGGPFSANGADPRDRYNAAMSSYRNSVELPYGCLVQMFPYLNLVANRIKVNTMNCLNYRNAILLYNCLLCTNNAHMIVSRMFDCEPMDIADYLR